MPGADDRRTRQVEVPSGGEVRVDWRVKVAQEGEAVVRMKALSDEESDAMEQRFPGLRARHAEDGKLFRCAAAGRHGRQNQTARARGAAHQPIAVGSAVLAHAGRRDGRCAAVPGRLSVRLHGANAQPIPADGDHAKSADQHGLGPEEDPGEAHQSERPGNWRRSRSAPPAGSDSTAIRCSMPTKLRGWSKTACSGSRKCNFPTAAGAGSAAGANKVIRTPRRLSCTGCKWRSKTTWRWCPACWIAAWSG